MKVNKQKEETVIFLDGYTEMSLVILKMITCECFLNESDFLIKKGGELVCDFQWLNLMGATREKLIYDYLHIKFYVTPGLACKDIHTLIQLAYWNTMCCE